MKTTRWLFVFLSFCGLLIGCERKADEASDLSFSIPKTKPTLKQESMSALNSEAKHIVFNVSGPGMPITQVCSVDVERNEVSGLCQFNKNLFELKITSPKGSDRLFQVVVVYEDSVTESLYFYYGEKVQSISNSVENMSMDISLAQSTNGGEGRVKGRYLTTSNSGPSGLLEIKGKFGSATSPAMTIFREEIWDGWFDIMTLEGLNFEYSAAGQVLFGGPRDLAYFKNSTNFPTNTVRGTVENGRDLIYGFFGPGISTQLVCLTDATPSSACSTAANEFSSFLNLYSSGTKSEFRGPYREISTGTYFSFASGVLSARLLPGDFSTIVDGFRLVKFSNAFNNPEQFISAFELDNDYVDCDRLVPAARLLPNVSVIDVSTLASSVITWTVGGTGGEKYLACAHKGGRHFRSVISNFDYHGGGGSPTEFKFRISEALAQNVCTRGEVEVLDSNGFSASLTAASTLQLSTSGSATVFQSNNGGPCDCSSAVASLPIAVPTGASRASFCYRTSDSPGLGFSMNGTFSGGLTHSANTPVAVVDPTSQVANLSVEYSPSSSKTNLGFCKAITIRAVNGSNSNVTTEYSPLSLSLRRYDGALASPSSIQFYGGAGGCSGGDAIGAAPSLTLYMGVKTVYVKGESLGSYYVEASYQTAQSINMVRKQHIEIIPTALATRISLVPGPQPLFSRNCIQYTAYSKDDFGNDVPLNSAVQLVSSINAGVSSVHASATCSSSISSIGLSNGVGIFFVSFLNTTTNSQTANISASINDGSINLFGNQSLQISPVYVQAELLDSSPFQNNGTCRAIVFRLRDAFTGGNDVFNESGGNAIFNAASFVGASEPTHYSLFSSSADCTAGTPLSSTTFIPNGMSSVPMFVRSTNVGSAAPASDFNFNIFGNLYNYGVKINFNTHFCPPTGGGAPCPI